MRRDVRHQEEELMDRTQWFILAANVLGGVFSSYLFRWQRAALILYRRLRAFRGIELPSHMILVPSWQVYASWPVFFAKWAAWIALWFFLPWYYPIGFVIVDFVLRAIHSVTILRTEHRDYFEQKCSLLGISLEEPTVEP